MLVQIPRSRCLSDVQKGPFLAGWGCLRRPACDSVGTGGPLFEVGCDGVLIGLGKGCSTVSRKTKLGSIGRTLTKWSK
jgi:hypothetical protein